MRMPFDIEKAREACNRATFHLVGDRIDEDLKVLVDQAALLPAALDALEASQTQCRDLTAEMAELRRTVDAQAGIIQAQRIRIEYLEQAADGKEEDLLLQEEGILP